MKAVLDHTRWCSGPIPGFVFRSHPWQSSETIYVLEFGNRSWLSSGIQGFILLCCPFNLRLIFNALTLPFGNSATFKYEPSLLYAGIKVLSLKS